MYHIIAGVSLLPLRANYWGFSHVLICLSYATVYVMTCGGILVGKRSQIGIETLAKTLCEMEENTHSILQRRAGREGEYNGTHFLSDPLMQHSNDAGALAV